MAEMMDTSDSKFFRNQDPLFQDRPGSVPGLSQRSWLLTRGRGRIDREAHILKLLIDSPLVVKVFFFTLLFR